MINFLHATLVSGNINIFGFVLVLFWETFQRIDPADPWPETSINSLKPILGQFQYDDAVLAIQEIPLWR